MADDRDNRSAVKRYNDRGEKTVLVVPDKKRPPDRDWAKKASQGHYGPDAFSENDNVGILLGEPSGWLVDVDADAPEAVAACGYLMPDTDRIHGRAGKRSSHLWYRSPGLDCYLKFKDIDKSALIELRASPSHQTVVPPSVHASGEAIEWERDGEPLEMDGELLKKVVAHVAIAALIARHWPKEQGARHELALVCGGFMAKAMPDDPATACKILETAFRVAGDEDWRDRARAARETIAKAQKDEDKKITGVPRFVREFPYGQKVADAILEWLGVKAEGVPAGRIEEINEKFFVVPYGEDVVVAQPGGRPDGTTAFWSFENFDKRFCHEKVTVGKQQMNMGRYWREHENSARKDRFVYAPTGSPELPLGPNDHNGWRGFTVEPAPGSWEKNKAHVLDVVCDRDRELFEWTMDWMASMFQLPGRHAMTALVLMGGQGAGKGHFVDKMLGRCFDRQHYVHVTDRKAVFGDFNDALSGRCLVFMDEATWGGDKRDAGIIKTLITEDFVSISRKFLPRVSERSMLHVAMASNEEWPVALDRDDRRFAVFQVSGRHANQQAYFRPLLDELAAGGRAAMLHELLARQITSDLTQPPSTEARTRLKRASFSPEVAWWFDKLEEGAILRGHNGWQTEVGKDELYDDYVERLSKAGTHRRKLESELGGLIRKMAPTVAERRSRPDMKRKWAFPSLAECRELFESFMKETYEWAADAGVHVRVADAGEL